MFAIYGQLLRRIHDMQFYILYATTVRLHILYLTYYSQVGIYFTTTKESLGTIQKYFEQTINLLLRNKVKLHTCTNDIKSLATAIDVSVARKSRLSLYNYVVQLLRGFIHSYVDFTLTKISVRVKLHYTQAAFVSYTLYPYGNMA